MKWPAVAWVVPVVFAVSSCSVPNLESPECSAARDVVRQYYSLAIGADPMSNPTALSKLKALRSTNFTVSPVRGDADQYHFTSQQPISYRVGECSDQTDRSVKTKVKVIWRINDQNSDRDDTVTLAKVDSAWLIDRVDVGEQPGPEF